MNLFDNSVAPKLTPKRLVKGDYRAWRNSALVTDYPTATYSLEYKLRREGEPAIEISIASSVDSAEYLFEISSITSAAYEVGIYHYDLYVIRTSDSERVTVDQGTIEVIPNKDEDSDDPRTLPRKMLYQIERAMLNRATNNQLDTLAYSLGVETSATRNPKDLTFHRDYWRRELIKANRKWRARNGKPHSGFIRFQG